jgi:hypothetical protein
MVQRDGSIEAPKRDLDQPSLLAKRINPKRETEM